MITKITKFNYIVKTQLEKCAHYVFKFEFQ